MNEDLILSVLKNVEHCGAKVVGMDIVKSVPEFFLVIDLDQMVEKNVEDTLNNIYGLLWTMCYGKVTDENRNNKITLNYKIKGE